MAGRLITTEQTPGGTAGYAAGFIPEIWSAEVIDQAKPNLVFKPLVWNWDPGECKVGDTIKVPLATNLTAEEKTQGTDWSATQGGTLGTRDISISYYWGVPFQVESIAEIQSNQNQRQLWTSEAAAALALKIDDSIAALMDAFSQTVGTLLVDLTDDDIIRALQYLDDANVKPSDRAMVIAPATKATLRKIDKFQYGQYRDSVGMFNPDVDMGWRWGQVYNVPVYVSPNVDGTNAAGHDNAVFHKQAVCIAMQKEPVTEAQYLVKSSAWFVVIWSVWGVREMRDTFGCCMFGK